MSKEIQLYSINDMQTMAQAVAASGLFGMKSPEQALALMLVAQAEGLHPATITQEYDIIQGRACRKSASLLARFQAMGGRVRWIETHHDRAEGEFTHPQGGSITVVWDIERAKRAGLYGKDNWKKYPEAMLRARCISEAIRAIYPAAIGGMMVSEEAQDMPAAIDITPTVEKGAALVASKAKAKVLEHEQNAPKTQPNGLGAYEQLTRDLTLVTDPGELTRLEEVGRSLWKELSDAQRSVLVDMIENAKQQCETNQEINNAE